jgi:hypothetical protein
MVRTVDEQLRVRVKVEVLELRNMVDALPIVLELVPPPKLLAPGELSTTSYLKYDRSFKSKTFFLSLESNATCHSTSLPVFSDRWRCKRRRGNFELKTKYGCFQTIFMLDWRIVS